MCWQSGETLLPWVPLSQQPPSCQPQPPHSQPSGCCPHRCRGEPKLPPQGKRVWEGVATRTLSPPCGPWRLLLTAPAAPSLQPGEADGPTLGLERLFVSPPPLLHGSRDRLESTSPPWGPNTGMERAPPCVAHTDLSIMCFNGGLLAPREEEPSKAAGQPGARWLAWVGSPHPCLHPAAQPGQPLQLVPSPKPPNSPASSHGAHLGGGGERGGGGGEASQSCCLVSKAMRRNGCSSRQVIPLCWSPRRRGWGAATDLSPGIPAPHPVGTSSPPGPAVLHAGQRRPGTTQGRREFHASCSLSVAISAGDGAGHSIPRHSCRHILQMPAGCRSQGEPQGLQTKRNTNVWCFCPISPGRRGHPWVLSPLALW